MKKLSLILLLAILFTAIFPTSVSAAKNGDILGNVLYTDAKTYINDCQIPVYSIKDKMFIVLSDLNNYGFDVKYDSATRTTTAVRNPYKHFTPIKNIDNTKKSGTFAFNYVYTDIKAYLGPKQVESYLIDGKAYICFNDLYDYGKSVWDGSNRSLKLTLIDKTPGINKFHHASLSSNEYGKNGEESIPGLDIWFKDKHNYINPNDFTNIILTRDGEIVNNKLKFSNYIEQFNFDGEEITSIHFAFNEENRKNGVYKLTGKYKGMDFEAVHTIGKTEQISQKPANPDDLFSVWYFGYVNKYDEYIKITEICFGFYGIQETFYLSDLSDLKLTLNGKEIEFSLADNVFKYPCINSLNNDETNFNLLFKEALTKPGTYQMTGKYRGKSFESIKLTIVE